MAELKKDKIEIDSATGYYFFSKRKLTDWPQVVFFISSYGGQSSFLFNILFLIPFGNFLNLIIKNNEKLPMKKE